ncbi:hypothetical protein ACFUGD_18705, partial [Streptomyces sp. NPDC057217]
MPAGPAPTTVTGAVAGAAPSAGRSRSASGYRYVGDYYLTTGRIQNYVPHSDPSRYAPRARYGG